MRIIPAIDLMDGKCVRLTQGDYKQGKTYHSDPLEVARAFEDAGIRYLHLVDLDGARAGRVIQWKVLDRLARGTGLRIDFGGGVKSDEDVRIVLEHGAKQLTGGSVAVHDSGTFLKWLKTYGPETILLGADARNGMIATHGWQQSTELHVLDFVGTYADAGIQSVICTDISRDGMLNGPAVELYTTILQQVPGLRLIASGGISSIDDVLQLKELGLDGAIIGKAIYEQQITLQQLSALC